jgi:hypothetical protein
VVAVAVEMVLVTCLVLAERITRPVGAVVQHLS